MSGADDGDRYVAERRTLNNLTLLRYIDVSNNGRAILEFGRVQATSRLVQNRDPSPL